MKKAKFTKLASRVGDIASRRAHRQLMRVPWDRFCKAYEEYIRWQSFALWARAIVEMEGRAPSWLEAILRKRCPGITEESARTGEPELLGLRLLPWAHSHAFDFAKQEGWLDALVFYGFRDTRAHGYWTYWEHCQSEWKKRRPVPVPTFAHWRRSALKRKLQGEVSCTTVARAVEDYLDFEALAYWLRPLFQAPTTQLPAHVTLVLGQESPRLLEFVRSESSAAREAKSRSWQRVFNWGKNHVLSHAKKEDWLDFVLRQIRIHPRHVRMADYARVWCRSRVENPASPHPSFGAWKKDAESYVRMNPKHVRNYE